MQAWPWLDTARILVLRFRADRLALTAGSLTFTTIISLVPLITVMLALFSAFPMFAALQEALQRYFLQTLVPDAIARPVMGAITQFSLRASRLGAFGLIALIVSALALMLTIDRALNAIWRVRRPRRIAQRVLLYWGAMTLGPLVFAVSLTATSYALSASRGLVGGLPRGVGFAVAVFEFLIEGIGVAALFHYVPNTFVRWRHALLGGGFVAICMVFGKRALTAYFGAVPTYALVYGAFATLPIFLVWIYASWVIVLLGAVIAAYAPLVGKHLTRWPDVPGADFHLALVVLAQLARSARRRPARHQGGRHRRRDRGRSAAGRSGARVPRRSRLGRTAAGAAGRAPRAARRSEDHARRAALCQAAARPGARSGGDVAARRLRPGAPRRAAAAGLALRAWPAAGPQPRTPLPTRRPERVRKVIE